MLNWRLLCSIFPFLFLSLYFQTECIIIKGSSIEGTAVLQDDRDFSGQMVVYLYKLQWNNDQILPLFKRQIFGTDGDSPLLITIAQSEPKNSNKVFSFSFENLNPANYSIFAFIDRNGAGKLNYSYEQPLGWYMDDDCFAPGGTAVCTSPIHLISEDDAHHPNVININDDNEGHKKKSTGLIQINVRAPHYLSKESKQTKNGKLAWVKGYPVLYSWGSSRERGRAHGYLLAPQIMDMIELFLLEDRVGSSSFYEKFVHANIPSFYNPSPSYMEEGKGIIEGMRSSGVNMTTSLGRDVDVVDLLALNAYCEVFIVALSKSQGKMDAKKQKELLEKYNQRGGMCTQFVFYGEQTRRGEVKGGTITGRNMDGEVDVRKLTVSHLIIFAVNPSDPDTQRYVHVMWPGFIGPSSGFNEAGFYLMENFGCTPPPPVYQNYPLVRDLIRSILWKKRNNSVVQPEDIKQEILSHHGTGNGSLASGRIFVFAQPYGENKEPTAAGFIFEGDRFGGEMRLPNYARPKTRESSTIMASNHYFQYNTDYLNPATCNGVPAGFSSLWRYQSGRNLVEALYRRNTTIGSAEVKRLLQSVTESITEHSIIFYPNQMKFEIAVAAQDPNVWDAPFLSWTAFTFEELFQI